MNEAFQFWIPILFNPYEESVNKTSSVFIKVFKGLNYLS